MKAKDLKAIVLAIPDDDDVYYSSYESYCGQWEKNDDFSLNRYRTESGELVLIICGEKPNDLLEEDDFLLQKDWAAFLDSFPAKKNWSWIKNSWSDRSIKVFFKVGTFEYGFIVTKITNYADKAFSYIKNGTTPFYFSSWQEFFEEAEPVAKKAAQKQREELEGLLVDQSSEQG